MSAPAKAAPTIEEIMSRIREDAARRRITGLDGASPATGPPATAGFTFNRAEVFQILQRAEENARVGTRVPEMQRFSNPLMRRAARAVARVVILLTQVITTPQRLFNQTVLQAFNLIIRMQDQQIDQLEKGMADVKARLTFQERAFKDMLQKIRSDLPDLPDSQTAASASEPLQHLTDPFYVAFENQFRGSREEVTERLEIYLPVIEAARAGTPERRILDVGSGRGEWLDLLASRGMEAYGVDVNQSLLQDCQQRGLAVEAGDGIRHLRQLPDASLGAVTAFHLIEHITFDRLIDLLDEILRVLKPGGVVVFETPNARNILVGAGDFYRDPTHRHPVHPDTLAFAAKSRGFARANAYFFAREGDLQILRPASEYRFARLIDYVRVSRDYALIAYRP